MRQGILTPMTTLNTPDAISTVQSFIAAIEAEDAATAESLVMPFGDDGMSFDLDAYPKADSVTIGEAIEEDGCVIIPCDFVKGDHSDTFPAVVMLHEGAHRINVMESARRAMGGVSMDDMMQSVTEQMTSMAEGMAGAMEAMAEGIGEAFGALGGEPSEPGDASEDDYYTDSITYHEEKVIPSMTNDFELLRNNDMTIDVDWSGTDNADDVVQLGSVFPQCLFGVCALLLNGSPVESTVRRDLTRITLEWDDSLDDAEIGYANNTLSISIGPFVYDTPVSAMSLGERIGQTLYA